MTTLRIATTNAGKLREFAEMLAPLGYVVHGVDDLPQFHVVEDGSTFEANAIKKAHSLMQLTSTMAIGDDSGLEVTALQGQPGIYSARYAGVAGAAADAANRRKLLEAMQQVPADTRQAQFVCVLALCRPHEAPVTFRGVLQGRIGFDERGSHGFGYDSIFEVPSLAKTCAELLPQEKHALSHRGHALRQLLTYLSTKPYHA